MNSRRILLAALLLCTFLPSAQAQASQDAQRSDAVLQKIKNLNLLNQILPVLMTKDQLRKILPSVERTRSGERKMWADEIAAVVALEAGVDGAIKEAYDRGQVPSVELMNKILNTMTVLALKREQFVGTEVAKVQAVIEATLNIGQRRAAANSLDVATYFPGEDPTKLTESRRLSGWVRYVLLDQDSYPILVKLSQ